MWKRAGFAGCALAVILTAAPMPAAAQALSVDDLVAKHLATKGGADKWKSIQTQKMTGVATAQGFQLNMTVYAKRPNQSRQELMLEIPGQPAVMIVNVFDGTTAWMINPMTGSDAPQAMPAADTATAKAQSEFDGALVDYKARGYTVLAMAPVTVAGKQAHHLKVTGANLPVQHVYLDPDTFVELRITTEGAAASETDLADYKAVDGIMVPHTIRISQGGVLQAELKITGVEFNVPLADTLFKVK